MRDFFFMLVMSIKVKLQRQILAGDAVDRSATDLYTAMKVRLAFPAVVVGFRLPASHERDLQNILRIQRPTDWLTNKTSLLVHATFFRAQAQSVPFHAWHAWVREQLGVGEPQHR